MTNQVPDRITLNREQLAALLAHHADVIAARWRAVAPGAGAWGVAASASLATHAGELTEGTAFASEMLDSMMVFPLEQSPMDQAALRDPITDPLAATIAAAIAEQCDMATDTTVVASVQGVAAVAATAARAAVFLEAAGVADGLRQVEPVTGARWSAQVSENVGVLRVADELRRRAGEQQPERKAACGDSAHRHTGPCSLYATAEQRDGVQS